MTDESHPNNPMLKMMSIRNFRLLFTGTATSLLGDQFALIATPWLVLQLTGDPLALGIVLALEGVPRAAFMLLGGAITDRLSPRTIMLAASTIRLILTAFWAFAIFTDTIQVWMLYVFGLVFGTVAGFAIPAENSIVPTLIEEKDLQAGNSLMIGVAQLVGFIGPTVAGILIGQYSKSLFGIGLAFAIDSVTFAVSAACLWMIRTEIKSQQPSEPVGSDSKNEGIFASVLAGIRYLWTDRALLLILTVLTAVNFLLAGPLLVGIPVLANQRLPEGAAAFGLLMSAFAGGNLAGCLIAGSLPHPGGRAIRVVILTLLAAFGAGVGAIGFIGSTRLDSCLLFLLGLGNGYIYIILFTWMQTRPPKEMLGRMMSIFMFSGQGLLPISQAISGAAIKWDLSLMFASAGCLVLLVVIWTALQPEFRIFAESLASQGNKAPPGT